MKPLRLLAAQVLVAFARRALAASTSSGADDTSMTPTVQCARGAIAPSLTLLPGIRLVQSMTVTGTAPPPGQGQFAGSGIAAGSLSSLPRKAGITKMDG